MKFPYGICDFQTIITEHYFYIDRTDKIPLIEQTGKQLLFLRPRRFGKSLLLSMLENYYDVTKAAQFKTLFGHLAIGNQPTPWHNQYLVMKWDFSMVSCQGDLTTLQGALHDHLNSRIKAFASQYQDLLPQSIEIASHNAIASWESLLLAVRQTPYRLYLLIDEYDNFANELMMGTRPISEERYQALLSGEGALTTIFKAVKAAGAGWGLERVFITGVSPVVLSDITSGYNIAENIYLQEDFNDLCGFSAAEITATLTQLVNECGQPLTKVTEAVMMMQTFYNGYQFSWHTQNSIYNPTLALYFMKAFQQQGGQYPEPMLDSNLALDRGKIAYISRLPNGEAVIMQILSDNPITVQTLTDRFGVEDMLRADNKDITFIASLLYYFGILTLAGKNHLNKILLRIPNLVVKKLYVDRFLTMLLPKLNTDEVTPLVETFYLQGHLQPLCNFIETHYFQVFSNRDYRWANELTIKTVFLTLLYNDFLYMMDSEMPLARGHADLTMLVRPDLREIPLLDILLEFKYVSLKETGLSGEQVKQMNRTELMALTPVQQKLAESQIQVNHYRSRLLNHYGKALRLHTYTVVAIGFDRLVWQEIITEDNEQVELLPLS